VIEAVVGVGMLAFGLASLVRPHLLDPLMRERWLIEYHPILRVAGGVMALVSGTFLILDGVL